MSSVIFCRAQPSIREDLSSVTQTQKPNDFPDLVFTEIPGAPKLSKPVLLMGQTKPVMGEGMGWAAPATYDWNGDKKKDLLIGEFASGMEDGQVIGNFIRIYLNIGTDGSPKFADEFHYAKPIYGSGNGTPLSIFTTCCMAFRPQFVDLNDDGYEDIVTGQYHPGEVTWFRGSRNGFFSGEFIKQEGNASANDVNLPITNPNSLWYWNYSSVGFGDFDGDDDFDMVVGGSALRISMNIGTRSDPKFGIRQLLLDINGNPLVVTKPIEKQVKKDRWAKNYLAGSPSTVPFVIDWDRDGVLDLLVTTAYYNGNESAVTFFKGVKTSSGYRFEQGIPLFYSRDHKKSFPGSWLRVYVTDWNNDGISDLLVGTSVAMLNGVFDSNLSWSWEEDTGIVKKNPGAYDHEQANLINEQMQMAEKGTPGYTTKAELIKLYYIKEEYRSLVHKGFVYIMLGEYIFK